MKTATDILQERISSYNETVSDFSKIRFTSKELGIFTGGMEEYASQFHPSPKENECRHNMFSVYSLNNFDSGGKSSWGLHKCAQCGKEESWQYDHV